MKCLAGGVWIPAFAGMPNETILPMKRPSSKTVFLASIAVLTMLVFANLQRQFGFPDTHFPMEKGEKIKLDEAGATQTFVARRNGLSGVNVLFGGSSIKEGGTLSFAILDEHCKTTLREERRFVRTLNAENSTDFFFSPLPDSDGKAFCFKTNFTPEKGSKKAAVFAIPNTLPNEKLSLSINGELRPGESLALRPVYRNASLFADIVELNHRISQYKPWFLKGAFLGALIALSVGLSYAFLFFTLSFSSKEDATLDNTPGTNQRNS